ncbi:glycosyltransferase [Candidatus Pacearchaeota archaeon]|nr:glycosyltransferase [Candidatus Pacearchaeota archaeon]
MNKKSIPIIAYMAVHNGADFIRQSIESIITSVDRFVILEGAWGENVAVNGQPRSTDGTLDILSELEARYPDKIEVCQYNDRSQLAQRNRIFNHIPKDCWLFIVDHDEVWDNENLTKLWMLLQNTGDLGVKVKSFTFVNDPYSYAPIAFPRCFRLRPENNYVFCAPNDLLCNGKQVKVVPHEDIEFFHYSYCHSPERFLEKKRERTKLNGYFPWSLDGNNQVYRSDANIRSFDRPHPPIMDGHPIMNRKPTRNGDHYVIIQHSGIGNIVHTTPLAKALRKMYPSAKISILTWSRSAKILEGWPVVDEVWVGDPNAYFAALKTPVKEVMLSPVGTLPLSQHVLKHSPMKLQFKAPWVMHEAEYHMMFARELGWEGDSPSPEVFIGPKNRETADYILTDHGVGPLFLTVNACYLKSDHWEKKHWGNHNYAEVLKWFVDKYNWDVVFVGAPADKKDAAEIIKLVGKGKMHNLCGLSGNIKDTAAVIERATLTLGNDGGLQHISAAVDTPTVTVFTFTNHVKNQPQHPLSELAMKECDNRLMCQHGGHVSCKCLNVPLDTVKSALEKVIDRS